MTAMTAGDPGSRRARRNAEEQEQSLTREPILRERDRLMATIARSAGLAFTIAVVLSISLPQALPYPWVYFPVLVCLIIVGYGFYRLPRDSSILWTLSIIVPGLVAMLIIAVYGGPDNVATTSALLLTAGGAIACSSIVLGTTTLRLVVMALSFVLSIGLLAAALPYGGSHTADSIRNIAIAVAGWVLVSILAIRFGRIVPMSMRRIHNMALAYNAERQASETEAQRRQGARLLHDTVLATLTLLAHSGIGVSEEALREQAAEDAALLRQLRLGFTPNPSASGDYRLRPVEESTLGNTLESVKQRFRRMGLEVNWHGTGQVLLPSEILDAFLLALAECLENVRRHAGVGEAHVTITDDDTTVRAMVTDAGVGFDLASIEPGRLGFTESIVARLRDVGGNARLFSSPGSGTTVVLEVPK